MQDGGRVVGHPAHEEKHDHHHRDLGGAGLLLVQEKGRVADTVTECRDDLGGGRTRRGSPGWRERERPGLWGLFVFYEVEVIINLLAIDALLCLNNYMKNNE